MTFIQHSRRCFEGFEMEGEDDILEADFIDGCWEVTKKPNVLCTGESNVHFWLIKRVLPLSSLIIKR